jgi:hypothetical protein
MKVIKDSVESLRAEREALQRELMGAHEMLAFVLDAVGEDVVVSKEALKRGLGPEVSIRIDDDLQSDAFVFGLDRGEDASE